MRGPMSLRREFPKPQHADPAESAQNDLKEGAHKLELTGGFWKRPVEGGVLRWW